MLEFYQNNENKTIFLNKSKVLYPEFHGKTVYYNYLFHLDPK